MDFLGQGEGQSVEFEKFIPSDDDIARELVAFSNSDGGKIIYGLDDKNKHLTGIEAPADFKEKIESIGKNRCAPKIMPEIDVLEKAGKKIVILSVTEGDEKPYRTDDIVYFRDGKESRPANEKEIKSITSPWSGKGLNKRQIRALQLASEHNNLTNREYREAFGVSHKTAHLELTMLVDKKLLLTQGSGRSTCYVLPLPKEEDIDEEMEEEK